METILHESSQVGVPSNVGHEKLNSVNGESLMRYSVAVNMNTEKADILYEKTNGNMSGDKTVNLDFQDITFTAVQGGICTKKIQKKILHEVTGKFPSGQLIAIMGPSGAGKSTLLDVLSGYRIRGVTGTVYVNGQRRDLKEFRKSSCYITQDDRLQPLLTVDENMHIAADLKLPAHVSDKEKNKIIDDILLTLKLDGSKKVRAAGLSGGQKKRLSIALELVNNPSIMFLDEPTTGLDSSSCTTCIKLLKQLTQQGKTIICTIHQPAASLFSMFDQVYVLADGYCLYQGATSRLIPFFEDIGFPCPMYHNPADYVIELACGEYGTDKRDVMIKTTNNGRSLQYFHEPEKLANRYNYKDNTKVVKTSGGLPTSPLHQLRVLLRRGFLKSFRDETLTYLRIGTNIAVGLMLGSIYWQAGSDGSKVMDNFNLLFTVLMHHMMATMMLTILTFPQEMSILMKEHFNRWYSLKMYYTSVVLVDIPISILCCFLFSSIIYYMTDQPQEMDRFSMFFVTSMLVVFVAQGFGLSIGAYFNVVNGTFMGPTLTIPILMFSGFAVRTSDIPGYMSWGTYVSYLRYGLEGIVNAIYGLDRPILECPEDKFCMYKYPKTLLETVDVRSDQFGNDVIALVIFLFVLRITAFVMLRLKLSSVR